MGNSIDQAELLRRTADRAIDHLESVGERPVGRPVDSGVLRATIGFDGSALPADGVDPARVIADLAEAAAPGLIASTGPRYFGFVTGGTLPAALAADWLVSAWDQNAFSYVSSPAGSVIEETAIRWTLDVLGLPAGASAGFTTGATTANIVGLAAGRQAILGRVGWDVARQGLIGAPRVHVLVGDEIHASAVEALRVVGLGTETAVRVPVDDQGAMRADAAENALAEAAAAGGPILVVLQAGNVNSGAFDPVGRIAAAAHEVGAWVHVDGAFGLWAAASPAYRHLLAGIETADSWATDTHKWLNVPYDCGFVAVRDRAAHYESMRMSGAYLVPAPDKELDPIDWVPEGSRRARSMPVYAALRSLGRDGLADVVDTCCALARRMAERLAAEPGIAILNDVVLNQVVVRFEGQPGEPEPASGDVRTRAVIAAVQADGTCWAGGTTWRGRAAMRISVSSWKTTEADIDRSADAILRCARAIT